MKNKENNQQGSVHLPPTWCSGICRNAMNEICIEHCAIKRDCSAFEPAKSLKLIDMPKFPNTANMTREEKFTSVTIYLAKIVDHLQGEPDEYIYPIRRPDLHSAGSRSLPENFKIQDLLPHISEEISSSEIGEERTSKGIGSSKVAGTTD